MSSSRLIPPMATPRPSRPLPSRHGRYIHPDTMRGFTELRSEKREVMDVYEAKNKAELEQLRETIDKDIRTKKIKMDGGKMLKTVSVKHEGKEFEVECVVIDGKNVYCGYLDEHVELAHAITHYFSHQIHGLVALK